MSKRTIAPGSAAKETKRTGKVLKIDRISTPASMKIVPANLTRETPMPPQQDMSALPAAPLHLDSAEPKPVPPAPQAASRRRLLPLAALTVGLVVVIGGLLVLQPAGEDSARAATPAASDAAQTAAAPEPARAAPTATPAPSADSWEANLVAEITSGTLAALRGKPSGDVTADKAAVIAVVETALQDGQTVEAIDKMVNDAVDAQQITVPDTLIGADGRVDITAIVSTIAETE